MCKKLNKIGKEFGRLLVIKEIEGYQHVHYLCKCSCGKEKIIASRRLTQNTNPTRSCGCINREIIKSIRTKYPNKRAFNSTYNVYRYNARTKGRVFELTHEQFAEITQGNCTYCGARPSNICTVKTGDQKDFIYNGIDRLDNEIGYIYTNCTPCCAVCNGMKRALSVSAFMEHIGSIHDHCVGKIRATAV